MRKRTRVAVVLLCAAALAGCTVDAPEPDATATESPDAAAPVTGAEPVMWGPTMVGYGSFRYISPANPRTRGTWYKTGFSPRKAQLTFYGLNDLPEAAEVLPELGTYTQGVSCVYAKKLEDIDLDVLRRLIAIAWTREDMPEPAA